MTPARGPQTQVFSNIDSNSNRDSNGCSNSNSTSNSNSDSNKTMDNPHSYDGRINYIHGHNVTYTKSMSRQQGVEAYLGQTPGFASARVVQLELVWG